MSTTVPLTSRSSSQPTTATAAPSRQVASRDGNTDRWPLLATTELCLGVTFDECPLLRRGRGSSRRPRRRNPRVGSHLPPGRAPRHPAALRLFRDEVVPAVRAAVGKR